MIRFSHPLVLIGVPAVAAFLAVVVRRPGIIPRVITTSLILVALAGPAIVRNHPEHNVLFLVDRSASVAQTATDAAIQSQIERLAVDNPAWQYGLIEFGRDATVSVPLGPAVPVLGPARIDPTSTRLTAAVDLALSILPDGGSRQLVLITDGRFSDDPDDAIGALQIAGIPASVWPVGQDAPADVAMTGLQVPAEVAVARPFELQVEITAASDGLATLAVYRDDALIAADSVEYSAGCTRFSIADELPEPGAHVYRAIVRHPDDPIPENDQLSALVTTTDRPSFLVVDPSETSAVPSFLDAIGLPYAITGSIPPLDTLSRFPQVVLTGTPLGSLTDTTVTELRSFVQDLGGGLLVVEGESDVRGFAGGAIERLLPVSYSTPETGQEASLAIAFVLDRSASMRAQVGPVGLTKIEILKEAAAASIQLLDSAALAGLVVFNREFEWILPFQPVGDASAVYEALRPLMATGGTDIYYPLVDALNRLETLEARSKHVLLISDGQTTHEIRDYPGLLRRLQMSEEITVSAIAVGVTPNIPLLTALVEAGRGALYRATDFSTLPQVSIHATQRISQRRFVTGTVGLTGPLSRLEDGTAIPPLGGYVVSYPRPSADVSLWAGDDPVVATWRIGRGSVTVLNTDLTGRWSADWLAWPRAAALFEAILRASQPDGALIAGLTTRLDIRDDRTDLLIDARGDDGHYVDFLPLEAILLPGPHPLRVEHVAPGLYLASMTTPPEGGYAIRIDDPTRDRSVTVPFVVPYPAEYRTLGVDSAAVHRIAQRTGGRMLSGEDALVPPSDGTAPTEQPLAPPLLLAALGLFLAELVARKLPRRGRPAG